MNKKTVILILVDGLRHDYINTVDSPFLYSIAKQNIEGVVRGTLASELRPAFFAGLQPEECSIVNMYCFNPDDSLFRSIDVSHGDRTKISHDLEAEAKRKGYSMVEHTGSSAEIPLQLLKYFDFSEKYHITEPSSVNSHKTLFDYLRSDSKRWLWIAAPDGSRTTGGVLGQFLDKFASDLDFICLHFSELEWAGYQFAPHSWEHKRVLKEIDKVVMEIYKKINQTFTDVRGIVLGNHGQVEIKNNIDIESRLKETGLKLEKDYVYFLDSTQARFWFFNDNARKKVNELLSTIHDGKILSKADYEQLHLSFKHNKNGELIFVVNKGIGIFPNFFQREKPIKCLHGYLPDVEDNWARLIITGCGINKSIKDPLEVVDIFPTLLELLDYEKPSNTKSKSVFEKNEIRMGLDTFKVSIIMPTYNRVNILKKSISAIEKQTCPKKDFEMVVVNDGSADGTQDFIEEYSGKTKLNFRYFNQENLGPAAARNRGIKNASGHIIVLVGDDMMMPPDFIENHLKFHQQWPQLNHACLGFIDWSRDIKINILMKLITSERGGQQFCYDSVGEKDPEDIGYKFFWSSNVSFKRLLGLTHGLFNDKVFKHAVCEDVELGYRLERVGLRLHFRKDYKVYHEHEINFEGFSERQRMMGWYCNDLFKLGVPIEYAHVDREKGRIYSKNALKDIVNSIKIFEKGCTENKIPILEKVYNIGLQYAAMVGYKEREGNLREDVGGISALLYNLSLTYEQLAKCNRQLAESNRMLVERDQQLSKKDRLYQDLLNTKSIKITAPLRALGRFIKKIKVYIL